MAKADLKLENIISFCKRKGFILPSSEIYGGIGALYDYGPLGSLLKNKVKDRWWKAMTRRADIEGIDAAILMHPKVWKASGHVDAFCDPLIDDKDSKQRFRADQLIEEQIAKLRKKKKDDKADALHAALTAALNADDACTALHELIISNEIKSPASGSMNWTDVRQFNLMFGTKLGAVDADAQDIYLRPETAQGIFVNFHHVRETMRRSLPFGIAQIGKAFRNEIVARQFVFRMREFEQMEMQYFIKPGAQKEHFEAWLDTRKAWHIGNGIAKENLRTHEHEKLAHYADAAIDIQYKYPMGWQEVEGIHSRTDFDLKQHAEFSGKKQDYFDAADDTHYIPYVVETSVGLDRTILMLLCDAYNEEEIVTQTDKGEKVDKRTVLNILPELAPVTAAVFPLVKKDGMPEMAKKILTDLMKRFDTRYDDKGAIGRRYRRMDEIGTPFCITVDGESVSDSTVTIRHRDTMAQERISVNKISDYIANGGCCETASRREKA